MKIKKYPQSHLVITNDLGKKLIIDPGYLTFEKFKVEEFQGADVYLITHQHADHLDTNTIKEVVGDAPVYGNSDVCAKLDEVGVKATEVKDRRAVSVAGFEITAVDLPHFQRTDGTPMPPNTGFLIDPSTSLGTGGIFFHPGDGVEFQGITSPNSAIVVSGPPNGPPWFEKALSMAQSLQAKVVIPIHFDKYPADPNEFSKLAKEQGIKVISLAAGEEVEL